MGLTRGLLCVAVAGALVACAAPEDDADSVRAALTAFAQNFNNKDQAATCRLFADDAVVSFPGRPAQDRTAFCQRIETIFADPAKGFSYAEPVIREILVDGDLAAVALVWTLTVRDRDGRLLESVQEDGLDVLHRQPDGSWRIHISHAFPIEDR